MSEPELVVDNHCRSCINKRNIRGDCHIRCVKPDIKMTGHSHGIENGWFVYPLNYDPRWMTKKCDNFKPRNLK